MIHGEFAYGNLKDNIKDFSARPYIQSLYTSSVINVMLLKTLKHRAELLLGAHNYSVVCYGTMMRYIIHHRHTVWRWRMFDHILLVNHYEEVSDKLVEIAPHVFTPDVLFGARHVIARVV